MNLLKQTNPLLFIGGNPVVLEQERRNVFEDRRRGCRAVDDALRTVDFDEDDEFRMINGRVAGEGRDGAAGPALVLAAWAGDLAGSGLGGDAMPGDFSRPSEAARGRTCQHRGNRL